MEWGTGCQNLAKEEGEENTTVQLYLLSSSNEPKSSNRNYQHVLIPMSSEQPCGKCV